MHKSNTEKTEKAQTQISTLEDNAFFKADVEVKWSPAEFTWKNGRISYEVWCQVVSFFKDTQKKFKSEANVRLYINRETGEWKAWAFPQTAVGMSVNEIEDHPQKAIDLQQFTDEWLELGTVHHHCNTTAFQSGTDVADEIDREGVHITCGYLERAEITTDIRYSYKRSFFKPKLTDFIATPLTFGENSLVTVAEQASALFLHNTPSVAYPKQWMDNMIEPPKKKDQLLPLFVVNEKFEAMYDIIAKKHGIVDTKAYHTRMFLKNNGIDATEFEEYVDLFDSEVAVAESTGASTNPTEKEKKEIDEYLEEYYNKTGGNGFTD